MYVQLFESGYHYLGRPGVAHVSRPILEMLKIVLAYEAHLFTDSELDCFERYNELSYNARYLFIRLLLRKPATWHGLGSLNYKSELGDAILDAVHELCGNEPKPTPPMLKSSTSEDGPASEQSAPNSLETSSIFAESDSQATLQELLECLTVPQLKDLAKRMKVKAESKRGPLIDALLVSASSQTTLSASLKSAAKAKGKAKADNFHQTRLPAALDRCCQGPCIRISDSVVQLFRRVNVIYLRSTQYSPTILTESILSRAKKRTYNVVKFHRTPDIWPTREALISYEEALLLEAQVDELLGAAPTPGNASRGRSRLFESVYPRWLSLVRTKTEHEERPRGLQRFDCGEFCVPPFFSRGCAHGNVAGHVLTRIVYKGAHALGLLHEYAAELQVLEELLAQKRWRRGKRGQWHERRALILMTHFPKDTETHERAMDVVIEALEDDDTHLIYRPKLTRRLTTLEKRLKVPVDERHVCEGELRKCQEVRITGVRVRHKAASLTLDQTGRLLNRPSAATQSLLSQRTLPFSQSENKPTIGKIEKWVGKSIWHGRDGEEVTVEILALQHYESLGYRGYHSEGSIVRMLFGLLFWDIIFAPIPGAFETPYQSAPLDIAEDSFLFSRVDLITARLAQIENGEASALIETTDDEHRPLGTWCVGVRWDMFPKEDLLEIADCLGGKSLSTICRLLCEDYSARAGGVPDLIVWNSESRDCKFVEVKGPDDKLQENQKLWIDVLLRAETVVEVCHVEEQGCVDGKKSKRRKKNDKELPETDESDYLQAESEDDDGPNTSQIAVQDSTGIKRTMEDTADPKSSDRPAKLPRL
ncbi:hypothetical protein GLOTRDRAFT_36429 [Gloeophyllum trabeum ATCC 11539]|uniref:Fanconi-associated nuclease n=1 Tax=Gloeophyllum trabeum (strain ATCC 11539 / FP-39264 / Madison 617) TaxID=670483 RepID=S7RX19_GLOTA|nr:uncharacterized protein GLOTRDRAFT_36429 [Gloeophyllum trabeum ATCC 11539]EPQ57894.1 hypothetical protein GLOTRDRAFT_36429 [Gloeophyllum trabeum ATCC 11539]